MQKKLLQLQRNEITEHHVYAHLASIVTDQRNKKILLKISKDEKRHYGILKKINGCDVAPVRWKIFYYIVITRLFGLAFGLRLMERGERLAGELYASLEGTQFRSLRRSIALDEQRHEKELIGLLSDAKLSYSSSFVLGLNDALVEFTGTLSGLTLVVKSSSSIAIVGIVLGVAASLSMAASEFLSAKEEGDVTKRPLQSALYTGSAYLTTVVILVAPYLIFSSVFTALFVMMGAALLIIFIYTFYIATAKNQAFWPRFAEMILISAGVAVISFLIGWGVRELTGVEV